MTKLILIDRPDVAVALCAASTDVETAVCFSTKLVVVDGKAPEWVQLLPLGEVKPVDGRDPWTNNEPDKVLAASASNMPRMVLDYDHGTDTGGSSRAAGWIVELKSVGPKGEPGIWGRMDWTSAGASAVASKEYCYLSPVFDFVKATRQVLAIKRAALTNDPALVMTALASAQPKKPTKETPLDLLAQLKKLLGLPETATEADVIAACKAMCDGQSAMAAKKKAMCSVLAAAGLTEDFDQFNDTAATAICTKIKAVPADATEVATLRAAHSTALARILELEGNAETQTAEQMVEAAIAAGKITPAQKDSALALCRHDVAAFKTHIEKAVPVIEPGSKAPRGKAPVGNGLTDEEKAVCRAMNLKEEDYAANKKALAASTGEEG